MNCKKLFSLVLQVINFIFWYLYSVIVFGNGIHIKR
jgi:hypothetical protein